MVAIKKLSQKEKERRIKEIKEILIYIRENPAERKQIKKIAATC